ncbi:MAG: translation initiation factor IF-2, partial [Clostridia bacterium]
QGAGYQGNNPRPQGAGYQGGQSRPQQSSGGKFGFTAAAPIIPQPTKNFANKTGIKKSPAQQQMEDRKSQNKRALIRKGFIVTDPIIIDEDGSETSRHLKRRPKKNEFIQPTSTKIENAVVTAGIIPIKLLSEKIGKTGGEILKQLMLLGILKTINDVIDFDTADLVAGEFGVKLTYEPEKTAEDILDDIEKVSDIDDGDNYCTRPPVVTIMGHVDHGKTSLLDCIRKTNVTQGEAGGITQHIGAYTVSLNNKPITFLDTPGHEAFTAMRMRGAQVTDIAIIVVAADDGVMPQTIEAINHAKQAGVSIIIAVNKIDKPAAQPEKVLQKLTEYGIVPEEWGGETPVVYVSAKTGENVNKLLETILLVAEILDLKANADRQARGSIIEARLDKGKGPLATVLVQNGTLHVGDFVVAGICVGKIRAMIDDKGRATKVAGPSIPVSVLGFSEVPNAGDPIMVVQDEKLAKQVATERQQKIRIDMNIAKPTASLEDIFAQIQKGVTKSLNIIIKADVQGSVEAVKQSIVKLSNDEVKIVVIHGAVGAINESDVMLANTSGSIIIGFNVRADVNAKANAERDNIDIRLYRIIYDAIDDVEKAIKGMLAPKFKEVSLGNAEIRQVYKITGVGSIAGAYVTDGKIIRTAKIRLYRDNTFIFEGELNSLKRFKDDVKEVAKGYECGMGITNYNDIKEGDVIEAFTMEQIND